MLGMSGGQLIAVLGDIPPEQARELAAARRGTVAGVALLLAESGAVHVTASAQVLMEAGWRVKVVPDAVRLATAWQELYRGTAAPAASASTNSAAITSSAAGSNADTGAAAGTSGAEAAHG
jgi:hypothetical protein